MKRISLSLTFLICTAIVNQAHGSGTFLMDASSIGLQSAFAHADTLKQLSQFSCDVVDQDSQKDAHFCGSATGSQIRCFADVHYENGKDMRVWGNKCFNSFSDCWWNHQGAVNPCH